MYASNALKNEYKSKVKKLFNNMEKDIFKIRDK
jgi:hypothetical protein